MDYRSNKESKIRTDDTTTSEYNEQDKQIKFVDHIKQLLENTCSDYENRMKMSIGELADKVGINRGVFAKIVNGSRPKGYSASRDCIIAIGVVLRLNQEETNKTLNLYGMPSLDSKLKREKKIIDELENEHDTLESFN